MNTLREKAENLAEVPSCSGSKNCNVFNSVMLCMVKPLSVNEGVEVLPRVKKKKITAKGSLA